MPSPINIPRKEYMSENRGNTKLDIPIFVVTGFLGSGKTTLITNLLKTVPEGTKAAVIVNEFASVGIDGKIISIGGTEVKELNNGCVCCTKSNELCGVISSLASEHRHDAVFLETTGIAELPKLLEALSGVASLHAIITVVDAFRLSRSSSLGKAALEQVAMSSLIVLNKCDTIRREEIQRCISLIKSSNPNAQIATSVHGNLDYSILQGLSIQQAIQTLPSSKKPFGIGLFSQQNKPMHSVSNITYITASKISKVGFNRFFNKWKGKVERIKGFLNFEGERSTMLINYSRGIEAIAVKSQPGMTSIVVIGKLSSLQKLMVFTELLALGRGSILGNLYDSWKNFILFVRNT